MRKLLAIVVLGFFLASCVQQNRNDEYSCMYDDKSGTVLINITKDQIIMPNSYTYQIKEETKDKIHGVVFEGKGHEVNITFYKRTKKLKQIYSVGSSEIFILDCTQLN